MKKVKTALLTAMVCLTACTAFTGCASSKPDVGHTPEEIETWLRDNDAAILDQDYEKFLGDIDCTVNYSEKKGKEKYFEFSTPGMTVYGTVNAKTNQMQEMVMKGWFYDKALDYTADVMAAGVDVSSGLDTIQSTVLFDTQSTCIILKELLGISLKDAFSIESDALDDFQSVTINGTDYNVYAVNTADGDGSLTVYLTTYPAEESGIEELEDYLATFQ